MNVSRSYLLIRSHGLIDEAISYDPDPSDGTILRTVYKREYYDDGFDGHVPVEQRDLTIREARRAYREDRRAGWFRREKHRYANA